MRTDITSGVARLAAGACLLAACSTGGNGFGGDAGNPFGGPDAGDAGAVDDSGFKGGDGATGGDAAGPPVIYANTDTELYSMDPASHAVTDIGPFDDGSGSLAPVTDLAVNAAGDVWVNTETAIFRATLPNGTGAVKLQKVTSIATKNSQKFYALGFAPAGVLDASETLVAGDNQGELYAVATNGTTTDLGSFGVDGSGNPYELSGDVVFYTQNGKPRGLATVRTCQKGGGSCSTTSDILAEVDVPAMQTAYQSKTPGDLKKQFLGSGSGFGRLYGVGAWNDKVYAFSRLGSGKPAQLIEIGANGTGTSLQQFAQITVGWSGAGVTTSATITVLPPN